MNLYEKIGEEKIDELVMHMYDDIIPHANRIHKDEAFLFNIKSSIKFVSTSSPEALREIFSRSDEDEVVA